MLQEILKLQEQIARKDAGINALEKRIDVLTETLEQAQARVEAAIFFLEVWILERNPTFIDMMISSQRRGDE